MQSRSQVLGGEVVRTPTRYSIKFAEKKTDLDFLMHFKDLELLN